MEFLSSAKVLGRASQPLRELIEVCVRKALYKYCSLVTSGLTLIRNAIIRLIAS